MLWLSGKKIVSKDYEYRIKSDIKKKIKILQQLELPLLAKHGFIDDLSVFTQLSANPQILNYSNTKKVQIKNSNESIQSNFVLNSSSDGNNTYKNNQIDNCEGAGGLAWLGYRLDMAGIVGSNPTRPISKTI